MGAEHFDTRCGAASLVSDKRVGSTNVNRSTCHVNKPTRANQRFLSGSYRPRGGGGLERSRRAVRKKKGNDKDHQNQLGRGGVGGLRAQGTWPEAKRRF